MFVNTTPLFSQNKSPKVVVVGAGIAGLTATYRLQQKGVDVDLYEARGRVGGRILTADVGGNITELGAHNITDGGEAENLLRLVKEFDLEIEEGEFLLSRHYYLEERQLLPMQQLVRDKQFDPEILKSRLEALAATCPTMREVFDNLLLESDPLYRSLAVRIAAYEGAPIEKLSSYYIETLYQMLLGGVSSVHQGNGVEENPIYLMNIKGGMGLLPEKIAQALEDRVHLSCPLRRVSKNPDGSYLLTFTNDQTARADILLLAIPCSVYEDILFEEGILPHERLSAIKNVPYGINAKMVIPYSKAPVKKIGIANDRAVVFFDKEFKFLTLFYTGIASHFSEETIGEIFSKEKPMIESQFGQSIPALPILAKDQAFVSYEGPVGYSWPNDPYVKGSYSYISPGQEKIFTDMEEVDGEPVKKLFAPVGKLYFAGEHTNVIVDIPGTMEAACESGERAARMILNSL